MKSWWQASTESWLGKNKPTFLNKKTQLEVWRTVCILLTNSGWLCFNTSKYQHDSMYIYQPNRCTLAGLILDVFLSSNSIVFAVYNALVMISFIYFISTTTAQGDLLQEKSKDSLLKKCGSYPSSISCPQLLFFPQQSFSVAIIVFILYSYNWDD